MPRRVLVFDTSVLCCYLKVPGKETAGSRSDEWNYDRIARLVKEEASNGAIFVLPLASIITGNHIAQAPGDRYTVAKSLAGLISAAARATTPWAAFTDQANLWGATQLETLAESWPSLAKAKTSIGDATIKNVAEYYAVAGLEVKILTGDAGLKAYEPLTPVLTPRRRR